MTVENPALAFWIADEPITIPRGSQANVTITVNSTEDFELNLTAQNDQTRPMFVDYLLYTQSDPTNLTTGINMTVPARGSATFGLNISVGSSAVVGGAVVYVHYFLNGSDIGRMPVPFTVA